MMNFNSNAILTSRVQQQQQQQQQSHPPQQSVNNKNFINQGVAMSDINKQSIPGTGNPQPLHNPQSTNNSNNHGLNLPSAQLLMQQQQQNRNSNAPHMPPTNTNKMIHQQMTSVTSSPSQQHSTFYQQQVSSIYPKYYLSQ